MLTVTKVKTYGWQAAIRGMRNPMNSWTKNDSCFGCNYSEHHFCNVCEDGHTGACPNYCKQYKLGPNDLDLATRLIKAGPEHAKFLRMIHVQMDINGPLYWWKEMDTYKVATTANSCSTMHKIAAKEFTLEDFSCEHLLEKEDDMLWSAKNILDEVIMGLNHYRKKYLETKSKPMKNEQARKELMKKYWWQLIQLLPSSYNQLRTWDASLATVLSICKQRKGHKLDEWEIFRQACFANIPYFNEFYNVMGGNN